MALRGADLTVLIRPSEYWELHMQINPEDYLNLDDVEMYGPSSIRFKGEETAPEVPSPSTIEEVAQALRQAQLQGNHAQIGVLSCQLDDLLAGETPAKAPESVSEEPKEEVDPETPEEAEEAPQSDFKDSDFNKSLVNELGAEETDELYQIVNDGAGDDVLEAFMESANGDGEYASQVIDWARNVKASGAAPTAGLEASAIDESTAQQIIGASEFGEEILQLNQQVSSGQMSKAQLFQEVMGNPALMAEAVRLRNSNLLQF